MHVCQVELVKLLQQGRGYVTAVGDDAQSIYGFRGASAGAFGAFRQEFGQYGLQECMLQHNYRSRPSILGVCAVAAIGRLRVLVGHSRVTQVAAHMLRHCDALTQKKMLTGKAEGEPVALWEHGTGR